MSSNVMFHFHGRFRFHMPEYNNDPRQPQSAFDPNLPIKDVRDLCGCDPAKYFEFSFFETSISQVTDADGSIHANDSLLGTAVSFGSLMVDVSPSAICAQVFAGEFSIGAAIKGRAQKAVQSDLRLNIRQSSFSDETAGAWFRTLVDIDSLNAPPGSLLRELSGLNNIELHFHLNRYTRLDNSDEPEAERLTGDVYGWFRPVPSKSEAATGHRLLNRRVVAHRALREDELLANMFLARAGRPVTRNEDIDGTYDIILPERLIVLRVLDFISFQDRLYTTPAVTGYEAFFQTSTDRVSLGRFFGTHAELKENGGCVVFKIPSQLDPVAGRLAVDAIMKDGTRRHLMEETEWDLVLESDRGVTMASGSSMEVTARVFQNNIPAKGILVNFQSQTANRRSPIVASLAGPGAMSDSTGRIRAKVVAINLEAAPPTPDPVTGGLMSGDLPWDRNYGNFVRLNIPNPLRSTTPAVEEVELAIRVLHRASKLSTPSFSHDVRPLFAYHTRYFPWLHTRVVGEKYARFLDLESYDDFSANVDDILERLGRADNDRKKMPRSRDLPIGGIDLIKQWRDSGMTT